METCEVRELLEGWARWRCEARRRVWPRRTVLGVLRDNMPSAKCTICNGTGKAPPEVLNILGVPENHFIKCLNCDRGRIRTTDARANPGLIRGKGPRLEPSYPEYEAIDRLVSGWSKDGKEIKYYYIIVYEYVMSGDQAYKAQRMNIALGTYSWRLVQAHKKIAQYFVETRTLDRTQELCEKKAE